VQMTIAKLLARELIALKINGNLRYNGHDGEGMSTYSIFDSINRWRSRSPERY
jgi:hypothetical protein